MVDHADRAVLPAALVEDVAGLERTGPHQAGRGALFGSEPAPRVRHAEDEGSVRLDHLAYGLQQPQSFRPPGDVRQDPERQQHEVERGCRSASASGSSPRMVSRPSRVKRCMRSAIVLRASGQISCATPLVPVSCRSGRVYRPVPPPMSRKRPPPIGPCVPDTRAKSGEFRPAAPASVCRIRLDRICRRSSQRHWPVRILCLLTFSVKRCGKNKYCECSTWYVASLFLTYRKSPFALRSQLIIVMWRFESIPR